MAADAGDLAAVIAELQRLMDESREGEGWRPWEMYRLPEVENHWTMTGIGFVDDDQGHRVEAMFPADAALIVLLHNSLPTLLAALLDRRDRRA